MVITLLFSSDRLLGRDAKMERRSPSSPNQPKPLKQSPVGLCLLRICLPHTISTLSHPLKRGLHRSEVPRYMSIRWMQMIHYTLFNYVLCTDFQVRMMALACRVQRHMRGVMLSISNSGTSLGWALRPQVRRGAGLRMSAGISY